MHVMQASLHLGGPDRNQSFRFCNPSSNATPQRCSLGRPLPVFSACPQAGGEKP